MAFIDEINYIDGEVPSKLFSLKADELSDYLEHPTLYYIPGNTDKNILLTVLLHGNETTGYYAVRDALLSLREAGKRPTPNVYWFIANVHAAKHGLRHLDQQPDFNRMWSRELGIYGANAMNLLEHVTKNKLECAVDFHNNTGLNPLYSCIHNIKKKSCNLAYMFSPTVVYFRQELQAHVVAFSPHTEAVTVECGLDGSENGYAAAHKMAFQLMAENEIPQAQDVIEKMILYDSCLRIRLCDNGSASFEDSALADFQFIKNLDTLNFKQLEKDTSIGLRKTNQKLQLDMFCKYACSDWVYYKHNQIYLKKGTIPSMFTKDVDVISQDCLGYLMRPINIKKFF